MHRLLICLVALIALPACGTKGPLYLPKPTATAPAKPVSAAAAAIPAADHSTAPQESNR